MFDYSSIFLLSITSFDTNSSHIWDEVAMLLLSYILSEYTCPTFFPDSLCRLLRQYPIRFCFLAKLLAVFLSHFHPSIGPALSKYVVAVQISCGIFAIDKNDASYASDITNFHVWYARRRTIQRTHILPIGSELLYRYALEPKVFL